MQNKKMNIVITGTSQGIGFELVRFLSVNHSVYALSSNPQKLKNRFNSHNLQIVPFDFRYDSIESILCQLPETIDILINNAGILVNKPFETLQPEDIDYVMTVNFKVPILLIQHLLDRFNNSSVRHVVNIGSMGGFQGSSKFPGLSIYSASKAALASATECLATEYADRGIRFNCLALGAVQTEMLSNAFPDYNAPLQPKEMAEFIADFALNQWKYFNGKILPVAISNP
jgi:NAD(P)-dependent dehydrogenase (short-subunit alcohol dehydrogenase family)